MLRNGTLFVPYYFRIKSHQQLAVLVLIVASKGSGRSVRAEEEKKKNNNNNNKGEILLLFYCMWCVV